MHLHYCSKQCILEALMNFQGLPIRQSDLRIYNRGIRNNSGFRNDTYKAVDDLPVMSLLGNRCFGINSDIKLI